MNNRCKQMSAQMRMCGVDYVTSNLFVHVFPVNIGYAENGKNQWLVRANAEWQTVGSDWKRKLGNGQCKQTDG